VGGEERDGTMPERGCGHGLLVVQSLGVGEPGVVVDRRVQVRVADLPGAGTGALGGPCGFGAAVVHSPATTGGDATELLDVDVDQVANPVVLVADDFAQLLAGGRIEVAQAAEPSPDEDSVHSGRCHGDAVQLLQFGGEPGGPVLGLAPQRLYQIGDVLARAVGAGDGPGGAIRQAVPAVGEPAGVPLGQAAAGDSCFRSDVCDWTSGIAPQAQAQTSFRG
jgi:hypothetical protein